MPALPSGTVTFLFTDLEGSTRQWEEDREAMAAAVARHDALLEDAIGRNGGVVFSYGGDGMAAAFGTAPGAVAAAIDAQRALSSETWDATGPLRARMGLHTGEGRVIGDQYESHTLNRCARLMGVAHGGQVVISGSTAALVDGQLPDVDLVDMGEHRLRDLQSSVHVFQVDAPGLEGEFPPLRSLDVLPGNLPRQLTTFIGREAEIATLADLVCTPSLVTLTGVGGVGKTRLALQVAAEVITEFPDGAWICAFAPIADPALAWDALAATLRVQALPGHSLEGAVLEYLTAKRLLLVLDNCEHLLDAIARQVDSITQRCAQVSVLATSREGLALSGERLVAVPALAVPADDTEIGALIEADSVRLFTDRAIAARSDFALTDRNATSVGVLCRRLDGIPLAIELAAARVRSMTPDDLVRRLDQRFKLLTRGSRAALERHQTLRSTIDWSYDLLEGAERQALDRLSVFAGSCDLPAAEAVLASNELDVFDVVEVLGLLVDKSLVVADDLEAESGVRYRLLESIRQYAAERLEVSGDTAAVRRRHADHYVALAESAGPHLRNRDQVEWAQRVLRDTDNFRAVVDWAIETPSPEHALRLVAPFAVTGMAIGDAAQEWAEAAIEIPGARDHRLFSEAVAWAALAATLETDFDRADVLVATAVEAQEALGTVNPSVQRARGVHALFRGDLDEALAQTEVWVDFERARDDQYGIAHALLLLAGATESTDLTARIALLEDTIRVARAGGIASALSIALPFLAGTLPVGEADRAVALLDEAIEVGLQLGDRRGVALVSGNRAAISFQRGDWSSALRGACEGAEQMLELGGDVTLRDFFHIGAATLNAFGQEEAAAVLTGRAEAMPAQNTAMAWLLEGIAVTKTAVLAALGEEQAAALAARGAALDNTEAVAYLRAQADTVLRES